MPMTRRHLLAGLAAAAGFLGPVRPTIAAIRGLDHLVVMFRELAPAIAAYRDLGFTVVPGGEHPVGTHNALITFDDGAYLELIAFKTANDKHRWWNAKEKGGGFIDFCMATDDLAADLASFRQAGVAMADPVPGGRARPDGYKLSWVTASAPAPFIFQAPFLIQDHTPRPERIGRETRHPNGVTGVASITVATADVARVRGWWSAALKQPGEPIRRADLDGSGVRFTAGPHVLDFVAPVSPASPLHAWLSQRGPSPYAISLRAPGGARRLDESKAGARITIES